MELKKCLGGCSCLFCMFSIAVWAAIWIAIRFSMAGGFLEANPVTIIGPVVGGFVFAFLSALLGLLVGWILYKCCD